MSFTKTQNKFSKGIDDKSDDTAVTIDGAGNVGIGTDNPKAPLMVSGAPELDRLVASFGDGLIATSGYQRGVINVNGRVNGVDGDADISFVTRTAADNNWLNASIGQDNAGSLTFANFGVASGAPTERMRIDANGRVGIGTDSPSGKLEVHGSSAEIVTSRISNPDVQLRLSAYQDQHAEMRVGSNHDLLFKTNNNNERMRITSDGKVGIGGQPGTREAGEYLEQAKTKLAGWKTTFDDRLKAEPKADKKAVTLEVTDGDFGVFPTAEVLAEKLAERAIGGGTARLQVDGDVYVNGVTETLTIQGITSVAYGLSFNDATDTCIQPIVNNAAVGNKVSLGNAGRTFKDGYFSGTVYANGSPLTRATDLISTLTTLRQATMDETQDIRESLRSAIDELVAGFEQQIAAMPSPDAGTMDLVSE